MTPEQIRVSDNLERAEDEYERALTNLRLRRIEYDQSNTSATENLDRLWSQFNRAWNDYDLALSKYDKAKEAYNTISTGPLPLTPNP